MCYICEECGFAITHRDRDIELDRCKVCGSSKVRETQKLPLDTHDDLETRLKQLKREYSEKEILDEL